MEMQNLANAILLTALWAQSGRQDSLWNRRAWCGDHDAHVRVFQILG